MQNRLVGVKSKVGFHILLGLLTFLTLTYKEACFALFLPLENKWQFFQENFYREVPYSLSLLIILFCHEMGHYLPARFYQIRATLPYFIPFPAGPIGTMGAVIQIKDSIKNKLELFDVGAGGPIMSLLLSIIAWCVGLSFSELVDVQLFDDKTSSIELGDSLFTFYTGQWILGPYDENTSTILIHPLAKAGWVGLLITAINLLPFGQLDGGHIIYSLFGEKYRKWIHYLFCVFLLLGFVNLTWTIWGFIIFYLIKVEHPFVPDGKPLDLYRKWIGFFLLISLFFIFVPSPIRTEKTNLLQDLIQKTIDLNK